MNIIFYYQVPLYYFQSWASKKLLQVIYNDITIELKLFSQDIAKVYIDDIAVAFLKDILKLERRIIYWHCEYFIIFFTHSGSGMATLFKTIFMQTAIFSKFNGC
ncbi:hypothetical protein [Spiroplasma endosymbiont of Agriotes lineatus]|uniref:hypothetical protein n=1 Tax=Spiroplasma endosymbiont of Agriotes lineatus TaxID=3077930 RepID=UPI0030D56C8F